MVRVDPNQLANAVNASQQRNQTGSTLASGSAIAGLGANINNLRSILGGAANPLSTGNQQQAASPFGEIAGVVMQTWFRQTFPVLNSIISGQQAFGNRGQQNTNTGSSSSQSPPYTIPSPSSNQTRTPRPTEVTAANASSGPGLSRLGQLTHASPSSNQDNTNDDSYTSSYLDSSESASPGSSRYGQIANG